jgi:hypothetical protein
MNGSTRKERMTPNAESIYEVEMGGVTLLNGQHYGVNRFPVTVEGTPQKVACIGQEWGRAKDRKARFTTVSWESFTEHANFTAAAVAAGNWLAALPTDAATVTITVDAQIYEVEHCALVTATAVPDGVLVRYSVSIVGGNFTPVVPI